MGSAVVDVVRSVDFPNYVFKLQNVQINCVDVLVGLFADRMAFSRSKLSDKNSIFLKRDDLLMLRYSVFTVRNVEICAVLSSKEVDL